MRAVNLDRQEISLEDTAVEELSSRLRGRLITADHASYDSVRQIWNGMIDRRPCLIVQCAGVADVLASVRFGRKHNLLTAIRGGGHNVAGNSVCDDGLVIDLSPMKAVRVDPVTRQVRAQAGARLGDLDRETEAFGVVVPSGIVTDTGVAGLTLGGGLGWLHRKWGLTCDNLVSADVVTADGELLQASEEVNSDLFWAIRGGGGNFGVVTSFEFRSRKFGPTALAGLIIYPFDRAKEVLEFYREFTDSAPEEVTSFAILRLAPPAPYIPEELHGTPIAAIGACYAGPADRGMDVIKPIKELGSPIADVLVPKPFLIHQSMLDAGLPSGAHYYWKSHYFDELTDSALSAIVECGSKIESPMSILALAQMGGAVSQVGEHETAYPNRSASFVMNINGASPDQAGADSVVSWTRNTWKTLKPHATGGMYLNFEAEEGVEAIYGKEKYRRLSEVKAKYDPDNFFRLNQNIKPG